MPDGLITSTSSSRSTALTFPQLRRTSPSVTIRRCASQTCRLSSSSMLRPPGCVAGCPLPRAIADVNEGLHHIKEIAGPRRRAECIMELPVEHVQPAIHGMRLEVRSKHALPDPGHLLL